MAASVRRRRRCAIRLVLLAHSVGCAAFAHCSGSAGTGRWGIEVVTRGIHVVDPGGGVLLIREGEEFE